jgi:hypothetical protein
VADANSWASTIASDSVTSNSIASGAGAIANAIAVVTMLLADTMALCAAVMGWILIVVTDAETETSWSDVAVPKDKKSTENRLREHVENAIEDGLGVRGYDIATFTKSPCDWVQDPEECRQRSAHEECAANIGSKRIGVFACLER